MILAQTPEFTIMLRILIATLCLLLGACSSVNNMFRNSAPEIPPTPLSKFKPTLELEQVWQRTVSAGSNNGRIRLHPAFAGTLVFAASPDGRISAYNAADGNQAWQVDSDLEISGGPGAGEGLVVVGTENGEVLALNTRDGSEVWRKQVSSEILSVPVADQNIVVVRTGDGKLYGLSVQDGSRLWVYDRAVPALSLRGNSTPVISGDWVIAGFDSGRLVSVELKDGQLVWESRIAIPSGRSELERLVDIDADPVVHNGMIYVVTYQGRIAAVDMHSGELVWRRDMSSHTGLGVTDSNVFVTDDDGRIWALDRDNSASVWRQDKLERRKATPPVNYIGYVVVGDFQGYVHFMGSDDGRFIARMQVDESGIEVAPVVHDGLLFVYAKGGSLTAIKLKGS